MKINDQYSCDSGTNGYLGEKKCKAACGMEDKKLNGQNICCAFCEEIEGCWGICPALLKNKEENQ